MLGSRIAALRKHAGLSQGALAARLHISPSTVGMYEQDRREPSVDTLIALAREFGVSVHYLLTGQSSTQQMRNVEPQTSSAFLGIPYSRTLSREELVVLLAAQFLNE